jgi:uncharacterized membrane protein YgcG
MIGGLNIIVFLLTIFYINTRKEHQSFIQAVREARKYSTPSYSSSSSSSYSSSSRFGGGGGNSGNGRSNY